MAFWRFFLSQHFEIGQLLLLPKPIAHRIVHVLRLKSLKQLNYCVLFNGDGFDYQAQLQFEGSQVRALIVDKKVNAERAALKIHFAFALLKKDKIEQLIKQVSEIGVYSIQPIITEFCNQRHLTDKSFQRLQQIIYAACEQSGQALLPKLNQPVRFAKWLATVEQEFNLKQRFACLLQGNSWQNYDLSFQKLEKATLVIGPEGGFSPTEQSELYQKFQPIRLTSTILRAENAAVFALGGLHAFAMKEKNLC